MQWTGNGIDEYTKEDVYCWTNRTEFSNSQIYVIFQVVGIFLLLLPILPITISCAVSTRIVLARRKLTKNSAVANKVKANATITIVLLTALYIACNIPLVVNSFIWLYELIKYGGDDGEFYDKTIFTQYYFWNFVDVLSVIVNSTLNFVIFITRVTKFRRWVYVMFYHWVLKKKDSYDPVIDTIRHGSVSRSMIRPMDKNRKLCTFQRCRVGAQTVLLY